MESEEFEEMLKVVNSSISRVKWRLKAAAKRRLEIDILALCTGLRPVVMVDYGGKKPELQEHLCSVLRLSQKESSFLQPLRVMVIEDMIYLIHVQGLADYALSSLSLELKLLFVDLEKDPPEILLQTEENVMVSELISIQNFFSSILSVNEANNGLLVAGSPPMTMINMKSSEHVSDPLSCAIELSACQSSEFIDLSSCMQHKQITMPTLNGWLLGYPIVYLFSKEFIANAVYNLSTKPLHLFKLVVGRNSTPSKRSCEEELLSFTVPYDLSMGGKNEAWAEEFLAHMQAKFERSKQPWRYLRMEVLECYPQAIAL